MEKKGVVGASMPQWISVKDRLPDQGEHVLVWHPDAGVKISFAITPRPWDTDPQTDKVFLFDGLYEPATHWMPLPAPPRGGE